MSDDFLFIDEKGNWKCRYCGASALLYGYHKPNCVTLLSEKNKSSLLCPKCGGPILYSEERRTPDIAGFSLVCKKDSSHLSITLLFPMFDLDVPHLAAAFAMGWEAAGGKTTIW